VLAAARRSKYPSAVRLLRESRIWNGSQTAAEHLGAAVNSSYGPLEVKKSDVVGLRAAEG
jgi:hypothetical protein